MIFAASCSFTALPFYDLYPKNPPGVEVQDCLVTPLSSSLHPLFPPTGVPSVPVANPSPRDPWTFLGLQEASVSGEEIP